MADMTEAVETLKRKLQFILRRTNDLQGEFEICDDINLATLGALGKIELDAEVDAIAA